MELLVELQYKETIRKKIGHQKTPPQFTQGYENMTV